MSGFSLRSLTFAVAVLAAAGAAREAYFHLWSERISSLPAAIREPRPEARYRAVRRLLPASGRVGYLTDVPVSATPAQRPGAEMGTWLYEQAAYALAPIVLAYGDDATEPVLANVVDPGKLDALASEHGLRVKARLENGAVALLGR
jgi:hypothetical protein